MYWVDLFGDSYAKIIHLGIPIRDPDIFIPWDLNESDFIGIFQEKNVIKVVEKGYFVRDITFLGEKHCNMGVYFKETLRRIAFSRDSYNDYNDILMSYNAFQVALKKAFGKPDKRKSIETDFQSCEWNISSNITICHYVINRFGLEEHMFIEHK